MSRPTHGGRRRLTRSWDRGDRRLRQRYALPLASDLRSEPLLWVLSCELRSKLRRGGLLCGVLAVLFAAMSWTAWRALG